MCTPGIKPGAMNLRSLVSSQGDDMQPFGPLDYVLDLGDRACCSSIESATPGVACKVLVYPEGDPSAERILATGTLRQMVRKIPIPWSTGSLSGQSRSAPQVDHIHSSNGHLLVFADNYQRTKT